MRRTLIVGGLLLLMAGLCLAEGEAEATTPQASGTGPDGLPQLTFTRDYATYLTWENPKGEETASARMQDLYGISLQYVSVAAGDYGTKLATLIAAGDPPDVVRFRANEFPALWVQGLFQPLDDFVQMELPFWDGVRPLMEDMRMEGKVMVAPADVAGDCAWIYNKKVFEDAGLETPHELQARGEWTWDNFLTLAVELTGDTTGDGVVNRYALGGTFPRLLDSLFASTGAKAYSIQDDGSLVANHKSDPRILQALEYFADLSEAGVLNTEAQGQDPAEQQFVAGNLVVYAQGIWRALHGVARNEAFDMEWADVITAPRPPGVDQDYFPGNAHMYMTPAGSANPQAAVAYATYRRVAVLRSRDRIPPSIQEFTDEWYAESNPGDDVLWYWDQLRDTLESSTPILENLGNGVLHRNNLYTPVMNGEMTPIQAIEAYVPQFEANMQDILAQQQ